jgi:hypothetical protein
MAPASYLVFFVLFSSKITGLFCFQVLEREQIMNKYHEVTAKLEQALSGISYEGLDISDEVKEQVENYLFMYIFGDVDSPEPTS